MTVLRQMGWTALLSVAALLAAGSEALAHPAPQPACGATVTSSTTLRADLTNCPGDGLVIGADGVRLDLGRHTIDGSGAPGSAGIRLDGHHGVTVSGGTVQGFDSGVALSGAERNRISHLALHGNAGRAIDLSAGSDRNQITGNDASGNGKTGIALTGSAGDVISDNTASRNAITGILLDGAGGNRIAGNHADGNVGNGIAIVDGSDGNLAAANAISGSQAGIVADSSAQNTVTLNQLSRNGDSIVILGDHNAVAGNAVSGSITCEDCGGDGIAVYGGDANVVTANIVRGVTTDGVAVAGATRTAVSANLVDGAGHDGFKIDSPGTTLTRNVAVHCGNLPIEAVAGVIVTPGRRWAPVPRARGRGGLRRGGARDAPAPARGAMNPRRRPRAGHHRRPEPPARTPRR